MRSFRALLEDRSSKVPLLITERGQFLLNDLAPGPEGDARPLGGPSNWRRIALSLHTPEALLKALIHLDGRADAILLVSPTLSSKLTNGLVAECGCSCIISDRADLSGAMPPAALSDIGLSLAPERETEWIMTTSGTTGHPKMVRHGLTSLTRTIRPLANLGSRPVWGLTYEPTRYAGMQVLLQASLGEGTLVAPNLQSDIGTILSFFATRRCSHSQQPPPCGGAC